jgi:hypothetical protein
VQRAAQAARVVVGQAAIGGALAACVGGQARLSGPRLGLLPGLHAGQRMRLSIEFVHMASCIPRCGRLR